MTDPTLQAYRDAREAVLDQLTRDETIASLAVNSWINGGRVVWPGADLSRANLPRADLRGAVLTGANLRGANLSGADLTGADLPRADLRGADLTGADLSGADLTGADLRGADLRGAVLRGAVLIRADLSRANLPRADLRGADLRGAVLRGANLPRANLAVAKYRDDTLAALVAAADRMDGYTFHLFRLEDGTHKVMAGCRWFTVDEYRAHVAKEYPGTDKARETLDILEFFERRLTSE
ncbi:MAG: pentapeptide repeat-containing protein [Phenylobacterium sp.]|nr:pentapeptide repeat-containing protein [Phenylobacterium sp.]